MTKFVPGIKLISCRRFYGFNDSHGSLNHGDMLIQYHNILFKTLFHSGSLGGVSDIKTVLKWNPSSSLDVGGAIRYHVIMEDLSDATTCSFTVDENYANFPLTFNYSNKHNVTITPENLAGLGISHSCFINDRHNLISDASLAKGTPTSTLVLVCLSSLVYIIIIDSLLSMI